MPIFVIEHLEDKVWPWCIIEYKNISKTVGKNNLWFTNIPKNSIYKLKAYGIVFTKSIKSMNLEKSCVMDPEAEKVLSPRDKKSFNYLIFGGILGDYPPKKRTKEELTRFLRNSSCRNIGKKQMSTDNAVYVANAIINGKSLDKIKFQDKLDIKINNIESIILPYRYALIKNKPFISNELISFLKKKKSF